MKCWIRIRIEVKKLDPDPHLSDLLIRNPVKKFKTNFILEEYTVEEVQSKIIFVSLSPLSQILRRPLQESANSPMGSSMAGLVLASTLFLTGMRTPKFIYIMVNPKQM
jgi:5-methylthioribose kinase